MRSRVGGGQPAPKPSASSATENGDRATQWGDGDPGRGGSEAALGIRAVRKNDGRRADERGNYRDRHTRGRRTTRARNHGTHTPPTTHSVALPTLPPSRRRDHPAPQEPSRYA